ncbi:hypothetical protein PN36_16180 [Candidatus Thiomargarita nelsonii]|uniref:Sulfotransferase domain-containing protein n=1 Tax=Candidatus Thiomargarita nelsonii TaxID=1003181 RepID=A0A0A6PCV8_9GAMM|nr:hypothetical protein PN36_16180 [Candidatus Thiomargarita nelsonii]
MMMKTVYIHIGTPKTGTTSLQTFFKINKTLLKQQGVYYPAEGSYYHNDGHHTLARAFYGENYHWVDPNDFKYTKEWCTTQIRQHINEAECNKILLSAERFWFVSAKELRAILDQMPLVCKIIVYLRRQDKRLVSIYNQRVKQCRKDRTHENFDNFIKIEIENKNSSFYHYPRITKLAKAFGKENIIVRAFEKQQWYHQSLIEDFLKILGLSLKPDFETTERQNESPPYELINLMKLLNRQSHLEIEQQLRLNWRLRNLPLEMELQDYDPLSPQLRRKIMDCFQADNEAVAREYLGRRDGQLFYEPLPNMAAPWKPYSGLSIEKVAKATVKIWQLEEEKRQKLLKQVDKLTQDIKIEKTINKQLELENKTLINMLTK